MVLMVCSLEVVVSILKKMSCSVRVANMYKNDDFGLVVRALPPNLSNPPPSPALVYPLCNKLIDQTTLMISSKLKTIVDVL